MLYIEDKVSKFIHNLKIDSEFGCDSDSDDIWGEDPILKTADLVFHNDYNVHYGASKYVLTLCHSNFVIKIPFSCRVYATYEGYDEENDEYYDLDEPDLDWEAFDVDYCAKEEEIYYNAVDAKLDFLFAKTQCVGHSLDGTPIYVQEKVNHFGVSFNNILATENSRKRASKMLDSAKHSHRLSEKWLGNVIDFYGEPVAEKLIEFIDENNINDLHCQNVGFRDDGTPVLVDYSGFYS